MIIEALAVSKPFYMTDLNIMVQIVAIELKSLNDTKYKHKLHFSLYAQNALLCFKCIIFAHFNSTICACVSTPRLRVIALKKIHCFTPLKDCCCL